MGWQILKQQKNTTILILIQHKISYEIRFFNKPILNAPYGQSLPTMGSILNLDYLFDQKHIFFNKI